VNNAQERGNWEDSRARLVSRIVVWIVLIVGGSAFLAFYELPHRHYSSIVGSVLVGVFSVVMLIKDIRKISAK